MKVGLNVLLWTAAAQEEDLPLLEKIARWGYEGVEFPIFTADCSPWERLRRTLDDLGLGRTACTIVREAANPISAEAAVRRAGIAHLQACVEACATLGAEILGGPLYSPCGRLVGRGPTREEWQWGVEAMQVVAEFASQYGVRLAVEPLNRFETYFLNGVNQACAFVEAIGHPAVGVLYDTFHANIEEKDPVGAVQQAGPKITHVHVSENDRSTPGAGHFPFAATFAALRAVGYDGWLTIEAFGRALPEVAAATCIWRDLMESEEALAEQAVAFVRRTWEAAV